MTKATQRRVMAEAKRQFRCHERLELVEEHDRDFLQCIACGALWSVHFDGAGHAIFDDIEYGDESCN